MSSYGTINDLRAMMPQIPSGAAIDHQLQEYLNRATAKIDGELGFSFAAFGAAVSDRDFLKATSSCYLVLPAYLDGSLTHIYELYQKGTASESTIEVLATEYDILVEGAANGQRLYRDTGWLAGWYRATAKWGCGEAPDDIIQVCLEKAINLFIGAQGGQFSDVVGVDGGGAVGYNRAWTNDQRRTLENTRLRYGEYGFA